MSPSVFLLWYGISSLENMTELTPARYFGFPVGCTVYNDGERLVFMKIGELWGANHDHLDTGCFQIYDGEILTGSSYGARYESETFEGDLDEILFQGQFVKDSISSAVRLSATFFALVNNAPALSESKQLM